MAVLLMLSVTNKFNVLGVTNKLIMLCRGAVPPFTKSSKFIGTGKSYVGQILVQFLLSNRSKLWPEPKSRRPILVVCFTNRALDSFLEATLTATKKVVRIGGRSKSEVLESHNLSLIKKWCKESGLKDSSVYKVEKNLEKELAEARSEAAELCRRINCSNGQDFDLNLSERFREIFDRLTEISGQLEDVRRMESASICRHADVVGLTTSGAAKYRNLVLMIDPKVVIVEEAGQVLDFFFQ
jgi:hypothetical protein